MGRLLVKQDTLSRHSIDPKKRVDSRSVFQPNARTKRSFTGHIVGHYHRTGPNAWDDYDFVSEDGGPTNVFPSVKIQIEPTGTRFRMRKGGKVLVLEWTPEPREQVGSEDPEEPRAAFLKDCVGTFKNKGGIGATAFIAKTLNR